MTATCGTRRCCSTPRSAQTLLLFSDSSAHNHKTHTLQVRALSTQVAYLIIYGNLPSAKELARWDEALMRHSAVPVAVERAVAALPHDAHFMGIVLTAINALSTVHPEQNPALAGQSVYDSPEIQDKQIVRLIGAAPRAAKGWPPVHLRGWETLTNSCRYAWQYTGSSCLTISF